MIQFKDVSKWYGKQKALDSLSLTIPEGKTTILLGPSGCGKSTTLRLINRLLIPDEGEILIDGKEIGQFSPEKLRRRMGYVIQSIALLPHMTVEENITLVPSLLKWEKQRKEARCIELLELTGLKADRYRTKYPSQLSGGEAQRIAVARALAADPPFLLMDEPFAAVDPLNRESLQREFIEIQRRLKKTVVFVTHDMEEALRLGDMIFILREGVMQQSGSPPEILGRPANGFVREFIGADRTLKLLSSYPAGKYMSPLPPGVGTVDAPVIDGRKTLKTALSVMLERGVHELVVLDEQEGKRGLLSKTTIEKLSHPAYGESHD